MPRMRSSGAQSLPEADVQAVASARTTAARAAAVVLLSDEVTKQPWG